jgi:hypothetical protein
MWKGGWSLLQRLIQLCTFAELRHRLSTRECESFGGHPPPEICLALLHCSPCAFVPVSSTVSSPILNSLLSILLADALGRFASSPLASSPSDLPAQTTIVVPYFCTLLFDKGDELFSVDTLPILRLRLSGRGAALCPFKLATNATRILFDANASLSARTSLVSLRGCQEVFLEGSLLRLRIDPFHRV